MNEMSQKLLLLYPEIVLFLGACIMMVLGLSKSASVRSLCAPITGLILAISALVAIPAVAEWLGLITTEQRQKTPLLLPWAKVMVAGVALIILPLLSGVVDRPLESAVRRGRLFDPGKSLRGEFYAFFLFSLAGVMLCATADDLIWLFLALELTSLPTYIMVALSTDRLRSMEAGIKYFFLGAFGAATFLMGFALIYGAAGTTNLHGISQMMTAGLIETGASEGEMGVRVYELGPMFIAGIALSIIGVSFKIAAVPMHFYTADVYQGAASPVSAYLAFAPKAAGFFALASLLSAVTWYVPAEGAPDVLPDAVRVLLWVMAALTMTVGNTLALQQRSAKRMLAYSSIAHSGYMLVALMAGPGKTAADDGLSAVLFYLLVYGVTNVGAFAVLGALEKETPTGRVVEAEDLDDLRGLCRSHPLLGWTLVICSLGLLGLPPLFGFWGKIPIFAAGLSAGETLLVVILAINSAAAAFYYLRLAAAPLLERPDDHQTRPVSNEIPGRRLAAALSATAVVVLVIFTGPLQRTAHEASRDAYLRIRDGERFREVIFRRPPAVTQGDRDSRGAVPVTDASSE